MAIIDAHVHTLGHERAGRVLEAMDSAGIERMCLLSPPALATIEEQRAALRWISGFTAEAPDRLLGYFWLNPLLPDAPSLVEAAAATPGVRAFKLMSDHWYPHDDTVRRVLGVIESSGKPVLFHAGILWSHMDSSRFCRPVDFEVLLHYPTLRFALAHMAWPWVEECFALAARMRDGIRKLVDAPNTMYVDLSPGTPDAVRRGALELAFEIGETDHLLFGSDDAEPETLAKAKRVLDNDRAHFADLAVPPEVVSDVLGGNTLRFLGMDT